MTAQYLEAKPKKWFLLLTVSHTVGRICYLGHARSWKSLIIGRRAKRMDEVIECCYGPVLWFTGMSGVGKTTVASEVGRIAQECEIDFDVIDGDSFRMDKQYRADFSKSSIIRNNQLIIKECERRRAKFRILAVSVISPFRGVREEARRRLSPCFFEIYLNASISCLRKRDTKGLYKAESLGLISNLIGVSGGSPYEEPDMPSLAFNTETTDSVMIAKEIQTKILQKIFPEFAT